MGSIDGLDLGGIRGLHLRLRGPVGGAVTRVGSGKSRSWAGGSCGFPSSSGATRSRTPWPFCSPVPSRCASSTASHRSGHAEPGGRTAPAPAGRRLPRPACARSGIRRRAGAGVGGQALGRHDRVPRRDGRARDTQPPAEGSDAPHHGRVRAQNACAGRRIHGLARYPPRQRGAHRAGARSPRAGRVPGRRARGAVRVRPWQSPRDRA